MDRGRFRAVGLFPASKAAFSEQRSIAVDAFDFEILRNPERRRFLRMLSRNPSLPEAQDRPKRDARGESHGNMRAEDEEAQRKGAGMQRAEQLVCGARAVRGIMHQEKRQA